MIRLTRLRAEQPPQSIAVNPRYIRAMAQRDGYTFIRMSDEPHYRVQENLETVEWLIRQTAKETQ